MGKEVYQPSTFSIKAGNVMMGAIEEKFKLNQKKHDLR